MCHLSPEDQYVCEIHQGLAEAVTSVLGSAQFPSGPFYHPRSSCCRFGHPRETSDCAGTFPDSNGISDYCKRRKRSHHTEPVPVSTLWAKLQAPPGILRQVRAWVRSGIMEADTFTPTTAGTPQGGTVSPLLALMALHGIDEALTQGYPDARVIAYADDCLVLHPDRSVLDHCQQLLMVWLARMGLTLNVNKTR